MIPTPTVDLGALRGTRLAREFRAAPLGFVDVGSLGGVHPVVAPIAEYVHALCFEPDAESFDALERKYAAKHAYAGVTLQRVALAGEVDPRRALHVSVTPTNTSLLEPNPAFIERYRAERFRESHVAHVATTTLDRAIYETPRPQRFGEFIKLDTQGSEYEILAGAARVLDERCVAVLCEVEFFEVYRGQKTLVDIAQLLRGHGLALYALYSHYRSAGKLDRRSRDTEERLMWADAVFFKDPLDDPARCRATSPREAQALILCAATTGFYDFALELVDAFVADAGERALLHAAIGAAAEAKRARLLADSRQALAGEPDFLRLARFLETHRDNASTEHLWARDSTAKDGA